MTTNEERFEAVLARLYTDEAYRTAFLASPEEAARAEGLDATDCEALAAIDREGLDMAAASYARKRQMKAGSGKPPSRRSVWARLWAAVAGQRPADSAHGARR